MVTIPFPAFEPDKSRFNIGSLPNTVNVIPTADGWGPMKASFRIGGAFEYLTDQSGNRLEWQIAASQDYLIVGAGGLPYGASTLATKCYGVIAARKADGTERIFAATSTKLWEYDVATTSWFEVTRTVGGNYTASASGWSFAHFGSYVYATNGVDVEQMIELEAGANFAPNTSAPICKYLAVVGDFMFRGNKTGAVYQVQWSAINNPQENTATVNMSDYQDIPTGNEVMAIVPLSDGAHVWMSDALHKMSFALNSEYVFSRNQLTEMRGTSAPKSVGIIAQDDYCIYADDGFWRYSGGQFSPIGEGRVNNWAYTNIDAGDRNDMVGIADPERKIVWWSFNNISNARVMLGYSYAYDRWCYVETSIRAGMRARTISYIVDGSQFSQEDVLRFAAIDNDGYLVFFEGDNMAATIETNEIQLDPSRRAFINSARLIGDPVNFTVTQKTGDYMGGTLTARSAVTPSSRTKAISLRGDGRVHKLTLNVPAAEAWSTVGSMEVDAVPGGKS